MSMGNYGGMILTGKAEDSEKNLSQYHFFHYICNMV
jgi:hypothetical protein